MPDEKVKKLYSELIKENDGIFLGEGDGTNLYKNLSHKEHMVNNMKFFSEQEVKVLYLGFISYEQNSLLDRFYNNEQGSEKELSEYLVKRWGDSSALGYMRIIKAAKENGIKAYAIDANDYGNIHTTSQLYENWQNNISNHSVTEVGKYVIYGPSEDNIPDLINYNNSESFESPTIASRLKIPEINLSGDIGETQNNIIGNIEDSYNIFMKDSLYQNIGYPETGLERLKEHLKKVAEESPKFEILKETSIYRMLQNDQSDEFPIYYFPENSVNELKKLSEDGGLPIKKVVLNELEKLSENFLPNEQRLLNKIEEFFREKGSNNELKKEINDIAYMLAESGYAPDINDGFDKEIKDVKKLLDRKEAKEFTKMVKEIVR